jgi:hypothetical protein
MKKSSQKTTLVMIFVRFYRMHIEIASRVTKTWYYTGNAAMQGKTWFV